MKKHQLSEKFFNELKKGRLKPFVKIVKDDDTICMELGGDHVNIYYRGGVLYNIKFNEKNENIEVELCHRYDYEKSYFNSPKEGIIQIKNDKDIDSIVQDKQIYKGIMDKYFSNKKRFLEKEYQQNIERENNNIKEIGKVSDYYIVDIEYEAGKGSPRFDMVAFKWEAESSKRRKRKDFQLAIIEVKFGDGAYKNNSGIYEHIKDFNKFKQKEIGEFVDDMSIVFNQKVKLGLVNSFKYDGEISISKENPEMLFVLANHNPKSSKLKEIASKLKKDNIDLTNIYLVKSSYVGYGLYRYDKNRSDMYDGIVDFI